MHPYGYPLWHYRPSRFIWFTIGAVTATLWMNRDRMRSGYCHRPPIRPFTEEPSDPSSVRKGTQWNERPLFSRRTEDKVTELSEATLDSILSTVEALKAKLAERKAERDGPEEEWKQTPRIP